MAEEKKIYIYDARNTLYSHKSTCACPAAVLTVAIESFDRTPGCSSRIGREFLTEENVGKNFDISILDPVLVGAVEFVGIGQKYIPASIYNNVINSFPKFFDYGDFAVFKQGDEYIIVDTDYLDVKPLF
ncbi:MAG: hypothetical protein LiPW41_689 [Parcubacteria group bacterium LiPW_41]|nr:MAG: hypothetical protein LiPW41_689 [Parcubacteria group bacterium LiPW_41]